MLVVIAVIGMAAAIVIPQATWVAPAAADAAAAEVAQAVRFAQREAIRTGKYQQVSVNPANQILRVYEPNSADGNTATHPVDKRAYQISFAGNAMPRAIIVSSVFKYEGGPTTNYASFGPDGAPGLLSGARDIDLLKDEGKITIRYGNVERVVRLAPVTGRVTF